MLTIRSMQSDDIGQVYSIELSAHRIPWSQDILRDCVLVGYDCLVLELRQGNTESIPAMVGYVIARRSFTIYHILNLCIAPIYQQQGFGKFLLKAVIDSLVSEQSIEIIILEVRPSNHAAIALYKAFGFQQDTVKPGYYKDADGQEEDAWLLKKMIPRAVLDTY